MIYLDNAATTMHKPQTVIDAVTQAMCSLGNAGRGATSGALDAARTIHGCRAKLARLLGCPRADRAQLGVTPAQPLGDGTGCDG